MKTPITDPIATASFVLVRADGNRTRLTARIGRPYASGDGEEARCPVALEGLDQQYPDMHGVDTMQALCLAIRTVRMRLVHQLEKGHRLEREDGSAFTIDDLDVLFGPSSIRGRVDRSER